MAHWDAASELTLWEAEMMRYLAHERRRLTLVAAVLILIGVLLLVAHALDDVDGRSLVPLGLDDVIAGYASECAIAVLAGATWLRGRGLAALSRRSNTGGV